RATRSECRLAASDDVVGRALDAPGDSGPRVRGALPGGGAGERVQSRAGGLALLGERLLEGIEHGTSLVGAVRRLLDGAADPLEEPPQVVALSIAAAREAFRQAPGQRHRKEHRRARAAEARPDDVRAAPVRVELGDETRRRSTRALVHADREVLLLIRRGARKK